MFELQISQIYKMFVSMQTIGPFLLDAQRMIFSVIAYSEVFEENLNNIVELIRPL